MRKISAQWIFPVSSEPIKNGIIEIDDHGVVIDVYKPEGNFREIAGLEFYNGILCPGFVNTHCHLELSHMKGELEQGQGLPGFVKAVNELRQFNQERIDTAIRQADKFMERSGVVAVGDISNNISTTEIKRKSKLFYHTFIECFGFLPERAESAIDHWTKVYKNFTREKLSTSLTGHAPYSVSDTLFQKIHSENNAQSLVSVHHLENSDEDELFQSKSGEMYNHLINNHGFDLSNWDPKYKTATEFIVQNTPSDSRLLLVHNTYATEKTIEYLRKNRYVENTFLVCCLRSNKYIDSALPNLHLLCESGFSVSLGTDSLASNQSLSILEEMKCISFEFENISLQEMIAMATLNGAKALDVDHCFGSIEPGKSCGINLISGLDLKQMKLLPKTTVKKIV